MLPNLPANRLHIRRKPAASHHSSMKITIRTLRLAERHLHVNPELPHHPKTLAHPRLNPATSKRGMWRFYGATLSITASLTIAVSTDLAFMAKLENFVKVFLDSSLSPVIIDLVDNSVCSAGACSRFSFYGCHLALC